MKTSKFDRDSLVKYIKRRNIDVDKSLDEFVQDFEAQTQRVAILEEAIQHYGPCCKESDLIGLRYGHLVEVLEAALQRSKELGT